MSPRGPTHASSLPGVAARPARHGGRRRGAGAEGDRGGARAPAGPEQLRAGGGSTEEAGWAGRRPPPPDRFPVLRVNQARLEMTGMCLGVMGSRILDGRKCVT